MLQEAADRVGLFRSSPGFGSNYSTRFRRRPSLALRRLDPRAVVLRRDQLPVWACTGICRTLAIMASTARSRRIEIRVTDEEHAFEEAAAQAMGVSLSEFYRRAARASAEEVLAERSRITLDDDEAARFLDALEHPERFEAGLRRLAERASILPS